MSYPDAIEAIKKSAAELHISQVDLAAASGVSPAYISRIFKLEREASDQVLIDMSKAVKLPPLEVLRLADRIPPETTTSNPIVKEITYITIDLPEADQKEILEFTKLRRRLAEERARYAPKRIDKKSSTTK